jgi:hypothetical protein
MEAILIMQKWEYGRLRIYNNGRVRDYTWRGQPIIGTIDDFMNKLGTESWELVAATQVWGYQADNDDFQLFFKRLIG